MRIRHEGGDRFVVSVRGHEIAVDQPVDQHGEDTAPTPTELFVASLATCVGFFARRYLRRHELPEAGLAVDAAFELSSDRPARVSRIDIRVILPAGLPAERTPAFLAVVERCTVHNSIERAPEVAIAVEAAHPAA
jgi:uncharacterized OsmC-like protein